MPHLLLAKPVLPDLPTPRRHLPRIALVRRRRLCKDGRGLASESGHGRVVRLLHETLVHGRRRHALEHVPHIALHRHQYGPPPVLELLLERLRRELGSVDVPQRADGRVHHAPVDAANLVVGEAGDPVPPRPE